MIPTATSNKYFKWRKMKVRNACSQASQLSRRACRSSPDEIVSSLRLKQQFPCPHMRAISTKHSRPAGMKKHLSKSNAGTYIRVVGVGVLISVSQRKEECSVFPNAHRSSQTLTLPGTLTKLNEETT